MAYQGSYGQRTVGTTGTELNAWALGLALFASMLMMLMGGFHIIVGLAALLDDSFYTVRENFALEMNVSAWGWLNILGGCVVMVAALGLIAGSSLARVVTIVIAAISILWNFYSIPYYPVWSIMMIAFGIGVIWALAAHGHDLEVVDQP
jgi:hypothetical protein